MPNVPAVFSMSLLNYMELQHPVDLIVHSQQFNLWKIYVGVIANLNIILK